LYYTVSVIIKLIGGRSVQRLRVLSQSVHRTATYMCDEILLTVHLNIFIY